MEHRRQEGILNVLQMVRNRTAIVFHVPRATKHQITCLEFQ